MRLWRGLALLLPLVFAHSGMAASFDCMKARTAIETLICADPGLSQLDEQLNHSYKKALSRIDEKAALKSSQRVWHSRLCGEVDCVRKRFAGRIALLDSVAQSGTDVSTWTGEYERYWNGRRDSNSSTLTIIALEGGRLRVDGLSLWYGPNAKLGQINTGEMGGFARVKDKTARHEDEHDEGEDDFCAANLRM